MIYKRTDGLSGETGETHSIIAPLLATHTGFRAAEPLSIGAGVRLLASIHFFLMQLQIAKYPK